MLDTGSKAKFVTIGNMTFPISFDILSNEIKKGGLSVIKDLLNKKDLFTDAAWQGLIQELGESWSGDEADLEERIDICKRIILFDPKEGKIDSYALGQKTNDPSFVAWIKFIDAWDNWAAKKGKAELDFIKKYLVTVFEADVVKFYHKLVASKSITESRELITQFVAQHSTALAEKDSGSEHPSERAEINMDIFNTYILNALAKTSGGNVLIKELLEAKDSRAAQSINGVMFLNGKLFTPPLTAMMNLEVENVRALLSLPQVDINAGIHTGTSCIFVNAIAKFASMYQFGAPKESFEKIGQIILAILAKSPVICASNDLTKNNIIGYLINCLEKHRELIISIYDRIVEEIEAASDEQLENFCYIDNGLLANLATVEHYIRHNDSYGSKREWYAKSLERLVLNAPGIAISKDNCLGKFLVEYNKPLILIWLLKEAKREMEALFGLNKESVSKESLELIVELTKTIAVKNNAQLIEYIKRFASLSLEDKKEGFPHFAQQLKLWAISGVTSEGQKWFNKIIFHLRADGFDRSDILDLIHGCMASVCLPNDVNLEFFAFAHTLALEYGSELGHDLKKITIGEIEFNLEYFRAERAFIESAKQMKDIKVLSAAIKEFAAKHKITPNNIKGYDSENLGHHLTLRPGFIKALRGLDIKTNEQDFLGVTLLMKFALDINTMEDLEVLKEAVDFVLEDKCCNDIITSLLNNAFVMENIALFKGNKKFIDLIKIQAITQERVDVLKAMLDKAVITVAELKKDADFIPEKIMKELGLDDKEKKSKKKPAKPAPETKVSALAKLMNRDGAKQSDFIELLKAGKFSEWEKDAVAKFIALPTFSATINTASKKLNTATLEELLKILISAAIASNKPDIMVELINLRPIDIIKDTARLIISGLEDGPEKRCVLDIFEKEFVKTKALPASTTELDTVVEGGFEPIKRQAKPAAGAGIPLGTRSPKPQTRVEKAAQPAVQSPKKGLRVGEGVPLNPVLSKRIEAIEASEKAESESKIAIDSQPLIIPEAPVAQVKLTEDVVSQLPIKVSEQTEAEPKIAIVSQPLATPEALVAQGEAIPASVPVDIVGQLPIKPEVPIESVALTETALGRAVAVEAATNLVPTEQVMELPRFISVPDPTAQAQAFCAGATAAFSVVAASMAQAMPVFPAQIIYVPVPILQPPAPPLPPPPNFNMPPYYGRGAQGRGRGGRY